LALVVVQLRVTVAPLSIVLGCALKEIVGVGSAVTVVDDAVVPPGPVAVAV
jgi:carbonic anhydrase/acetyltransferase-like protein (isoleucine patch superfamily)